MYLGKAEVSICSIYEFNCLPEGVLLKLLLSELKFLVLCKKCINKLLNLLLFLG